MVTKISITTGEAPVDVGVRQPGEAPHVRTIEPGSGYDFEVVGHAAITIGEGPAAAAEPAPEPQPDTGEQPAENPDADFEAENDANEHVRRPRKR